MNNDKTQNKVKSGYLKRGATQYCTAALQKA